jgi:hypothetical protein
MTIDGSPTHFRFKITEHVGPGRTLEVRCDHSTVTQLTVMSRLTLHLRQSTDGSVTIVEAFDDQINRYEGTTFAELCRKHPRFVRDRFFSALDQLGIIVPGIDPSAEVLR